MSIKALAQNAGQMHPSTESAGLTLEAIKRKDTGSFNQMCKNNEKLCIIFTSQ